MNFTELQTNLQLITKEKISLSEPGRILNLSRSNISLRAKNNSEITVSELQCIEKFYGVSIYKSNVFTLERQNDTTIPEKATKLGHRLGELQDKHEYLDKDMAKLLRISEEEYVDLKCRNAELEFKVLLRLKQCFKVSIDWLLFGE